jgi:hypothetical protein
LPVDFAIAVHCGFDSKMAEDRIKEKIKILIANRIVFMGFYGERLYSNLHIFVLIVVDR